MIVIYGSAQCPKALKLLGGCKEKNIGAEFRDISASLKDLAEFIAIRDGDAAFAAAKKAVRLGIPCVLLEDGRIFDGGEEPFSPSALQRIPAVHWWLVEGVVTY